MHAETEHCDFGLIGLAVMGENLALNIESRGFSVAVNNRTTSKVDALLAGRGKGKRFVGCHSVAELVAALARPRKVMLMVKAGPAVDALIDELLPLLEPGDVILALNRAPLERADDLPGYLEEAGRWVRLDVQRRGRRVQLQFRL